MRTDQPDFLSQIEQRLAALEARLSQLADRGLIGQVQRAIEIARVDQPFALVKARFLLEKVVGDIYRRELPQERPKPLFDMIGALCEQKAVFSKRVTADLDYIRIKGNLILHPSEEPPEASEREVEIILLLTINLVEWYLTGYLPEPIAAREEPPPLPPCPYRGLLAFGEADSANYFGREPDKADVIAALERQPLVAIVGPSGSGKSSLAYAGVAAELRQSGDWAIAAFRPRARPYGELAQALVALWNTDPVERLVQATSLAKHWAAGEIPLSEALREGLRQSQAQRLLLIADQFEELYTQGLPTEQIQGFLDLLTAAIEQSAPPPGEPPPLCLLLTLRADFLGHALAHPGLAAAIDRYPKKLLGPVEDPQRLRAIIEQPARNAGVELEALLAERLLRDLAQLPGESEQGASLPLLEFTLAQLWERQQERRLTHLGYEELGGIHQALARHADALYQRLDPDERSQMRQILVQLVRPGEGTEDTRQVATREQLRPEHWPLITRLADQRLLVTGHDQTTDQDTAELIHEALIRHWPPLRQWIDQDRQFRLWQNRLRQALQDWQASGEESDALLRGARLAEAEERLEAYHESLSDAEQEYIAASLAEREREARAKRRRVRFTIAGLVVGLLITIGLSLWVNQERQQAEGQRELARKAEQLARAQADIAEEQKRLANAREQEAETERVKAKRQEALAIGRQLAAQATLELTKSPNDAVKGTLLAAESLRHAHTLEGYDAWTTAMRLLPRGVRRLEHRESVAQVAFTPDGSRLAAAVSDGSTAAGRAQLWDLATGQVLSSFEHDGWIADTRFSPDGRWIAIGSWDHSLVIADAETGKAVRRLARADAVSALAFSPDSNRLAIGEKHGRIEIIDPASGAGITRLRLQDQIEYLAWSDDGRRIAAASKDGVATLWQAATGEQLARLATGEIPGGLMFSPFGTRLVTWSQDSFSNPLYDIETGLVADSVDGQLKAYTPDGTGLLISSEDGLVLSDAKTGSKLAAWSLGAYGAAVDEEATPVAVVHSNKEVVVLDLRSGQEHLRLQHDADVTGVAISPDGRRIATASRDDNLVGIWDTSSGQELLRLSVEGEWNINVQFSPDGRRLLTTRHVSGNYRHAWGEVMLWAAADWSQVGRIAEAPIGINDIAFDQHGETIAVARSDQTVQVVNAASGEELARLAFGDEVWSARFLEKDRLLVKFRGQQYPIDIFNVRDGRRISRISSAGGVDYVSIDEAGRRIAMSFIGESTYRIWDAASGSETHNFKTGCCLSPSGRRYLRKSDGLIEVRDVETDGVVSRIRSGISNPMQLLVSPDGTRLAVHAVTEVELWDIESETLVARITHPYPRPSGRVPYPDEPQYQSIVDCRFSPDGRLLATRSPRQPLRIWNAESGQQVQQIGSANDAAPSGFAFAPDGRLVATISNEGDHVSIWDTETGARVGLFDPDGYINSSTFSPDGSRLVLGVSRPDSGGAVQLWNISDKRLLYELPYSGRYKATAVVFSHNGAWLAVGGYDAGAGVVVWDLKTGKEHARLKPDASVQKLAFTADDAHLITHDTTWSVRIWDLGSGVEEHRIGQESGLEWVAYDRRGRRIATSTEARVRVWDTATGREILSLRQDRDIRHLAMSQDGTLLAFAGQDSSRLEVIEIDRAVQSNDPFHFESLTLDHGATIKELAFSADGRFIVSSGADDKTRIWDLRTGDETMQLSHDGSVEKLAISDDNRVLAGYVKRGNAPSEVVLWQLETGDRLQVVPVEAADLRFRPGTEQLAIASRDGTVRIVDAAPALPELSRAALGERVWDAAISPAGTLVAVRRNEDPVVEVRDVATGALVTKVAHDDDVWDIAFSPDGKMLATRSKDQTTRLWDPTTGAELLRVDTPEGNGLLRFGPSSERMLFSRPTRSKREEDHLEVRDTRTGAIVGKPITGFVNGVAFSPDSRYLAMGIGAYAPMKEYPFRKPLGFFGLRIWDIEAGQEVLRLPHEDGIFHVHFSPDGTLLATTNDGRNSIWLWHRRDGYRASELARTTHQKLFGQIAFGPDGRVLAARSDQELSVWDLDERALVSRLQRGGLGPFTFSPDGRLIAVKADDGGLVWDWQSDQLLARMEAVDEMQFTPDSRRLIAVHDDDHVGVWEIGADDLIADACSRLERNLTREEWGTYLGDAEYRPTCPGLPFPAK